jgi:hypothetical protein
MSILDDAAKEISSTQPTQPTQPNQPTVTAPTSTSVSILDQAAQEVAAEAKTTPTQSRGLSDAELGTLAANAATGAAGISPNPLTAGVAKGTMETLHTLGAAAGHLMPTSWRDKLGLPSSFTEPDYLQSSNGAETAGKVAENIAEFAMGDEALKGLQISARLGIASKLATMAKSSPYVARMLELGMNAVRGGFVTVPQQMAHGATPAQALKTGAEATALGAGTGAVIETASPLVGKAAKAVRDVIDTHAVQEPLQTGVRDILGNAAEDAGVTKSASPSIRKVAEDTADAVYAKSKSQYAALDEATGGRFQRFKDRLDNIRQGLNSLTGTEEDAVKEAKLLQAQHETEQAMQEAFEDAKKSGIAPRLVDEANANFKRSQALYDLDSTIKKTVSGGRPGVTSEQQLEKARELIDPKKFLNRVNNLYDSGRLQDALGVKGADDMFNHALENSVNHSQILRNQRIAKYAAGAVGLTAFGHGAVSHMAHAVAPIIP